MCFNLSCTLLSVILIGLLSVNTRGEDSKVESITVVIDGNIYLIWHKDKLSWWAARDFCEERKMKLLSIQTEEKSKLVNNYLKENGFVDKEEIGNEYIYWTSGTDQKHEGVFKWHATGEDLTFTNWLPGMPDNWRKDENCIELGFRELGKWNDNRCRYHRHFICEIPQGVDAGIV